MAGAGHVGQVAASGQGVGLLAVDRPGALVEWLVLEPVVSALLGLEDLESSAGVGGVVVGSQGGRLLAWI